MDRVTNALEVESGAIADVAADASGVRVFKGIPYAAPPVGDLRWRKPAPVRPWAGVRPADTWGPRAMQGDRLGDIDPLNKRMSEDCLYLNVWTPSRSHDARLPVMVWIHGGSNNVGAGSEPTYDGAALARKGVIVVTINYRLDVFGFLAHRDLTSESGDGASGNYALLDQIASLKWVRRNIGAFGGDPECVTVFGESAGAMDISLLMASPLSRGLFARAIGQSGGSLKPVPLFGPIPLALGEEHGHKFMTALGATSIAELRAKPAEEILQASLKNPLFYGFGVVDGAVVPEHPAKIYAEGKQHPIPLLVGWNADEGSYFAARMATWGSGQPSHAERVRAWFKDEADAALALYPPGRTPADDPAAFAPWFGDEIIGYGAWAWAERNAETNKAPTYRYLFNRRPPGAPELSICPLTAPGVYHAAELYYVWSNLQVRDWPWAADDRRLADVMSSYWVNFARTGNPNGPGLPEWPAYQAGGGRVMELGKDIGAAPERHRDSYEFLDRYYRAAASG